MFGFIQSIINYINKKVSFFQCDEECCDEIHSLSKKIKYLMNDPSTPDLVVEKDAMSFPKNSPRVHVIGYTGEGTEIGSYEWLSAQAHTTLAGTMHILQGKTGRPIKRWPGTKQLNVNPRAGVDLNAYYNRKGLMFFYAQDPVTKKVIHTAASVDIVAHEMGHATLDSLRPDLWSVQALEVWSFHEAWADIIAMFTVMREPKVREYVLKQTSNNLFKPNVISNLAEEMGNTIYNYTQGKDGRKPGALRSAINDFKYTTPEKLPRNAPNDKLAAECHSFGRVFLGAFYEIFAEIHARHMKEGQEPFKALTSASEVCLHLIGRAATLAPATPRFYDAVARSMLTIDKQRMGSKYNDILRGVFSSRNILLKKRMMALSNIKFSDLSITDDDEVMSDLDKVCVRKHSTKTMKLSDHFGVRAQSGNPLYNIEIEIPFESYMEFDNQGNMTDQISTTEKMAVNSARACIEFLHKENMVNDGPISEESFDKEFSIVNEKLVRNFFV